MEIRVNIAKTVKRILRERRKTLSELSEELNIPLSSMKNYASAAANPRADTIELLAERLGLTPAELICQMPEDRTEADAALRAAGLFGELPTERQKEGVELFLKLVALFAGEMDDAGKN